MTVPNGSRTVCNFIFRCWHSCVESWFPRIWSSFAEKVYNHITSGYYTRILLMILALQLYFRLAKSFLKIKTQSTPHRRNLKRRFHSENASNVFRPRYTGEVWKRSNRRSFWICIWGRPWQGNHMNIVMSSLSKYCVFKMFSVHTGMPRNHDRNVWLGWNLTVNLPSMSVG